MKLYEEKKKYDDLLSRASLSCVSGLSVCQKTALALLNKAFPDESSLLYRIKGRSRSVSVYPVGDNAITVKFSDEISDQASAGISTLFSYLKTLSHPGITDLIPSYCELLICYDPKLILSKELKRHIWKGLHFNLSDSSCGKVLEIPVIYGGKYGPDLKYVAQNAGISEEEVIKRHSSRDYPIRMLGFLPGFPYLSGLDETIATPRLPSPRQKIPAGSVGIAGKQTGIYPMESPGGWQLIGRTPLKVYCPERDPSVLYSAGDIIRFTPIDEETFLKMEKENEGNSVNSFSPPHTGTYIDAPGVKVINPGPFTTVQDQGRRGHMGDGIPEAGAMDKESLKNGNLMLGNDENEAALECTFAGCSLLFTAGKRFVLTGADMNAALDGKPVMVNTVAEAGKGSTLSLGTAITGLRSYICFEGGIKLPKVLGSLSTDCKCRMGGLEGRKLAAGDFVPFKEHANTANGVSTVKCTTRDMPSTDFESVHEIRAVPGPEDNMFSWGERLKFYSTPYTISAQADRMGYRLTGEKISAKTTSDIISNGIVFGSVQITSEGLPIIMMADHQTTGGYAKIATVISADLPLLAQLRPGQKVKFVPMSQGDAQKEKE